MYSNYFSIIIGSILFSLLLYSCGKNAEGVADSDFIACVDSICYELDDETPYVQSYVQFIPGEKINRFSFLNENSNSVYIYNAETGEFLQSIKLDKEGAKGVGTLQAYYYHNDDSIFTYQYGSTKLKLIDRNQEVLDTYELYNGKEHLSDMTMLYSAPYVDTISPLLYFGGRVILPSSFLAETNHETVDNTFVTMLCDIATHEVTHANSYPEMYVSSNWGGGFFYRQVRHCRGLDGNLILSFPADNHLWVYNISTGDYLSVDGKSKAIDSIVPLEDSKGEFVENTREEIKNWYYSQPSYEGVFADPYKGLYYRIARLPNGEPSEGFNNKRVVIVVFDRDFNYLGEQELPDGILYDTFNAYVSPKGLNIHVYEPEIESQWKYLTFSIKNK